MHDGTIFCSDLQGNRLSGKDFSVVSCFWIVLTTACISAKMILC